MVMDSKVVQKVKPYLGVIFLQFGSAGFGIVAKAALNQGSSNFTFSVYRNAIAAALFIPFAFFLERIEKVNLKSVRSHAKIMGTLVTVGGAMIMTLIVGPVIGLPWTHKSQDGKSASTNAEDPVKGAIMIATGCLGYSLFYTLQAITLKSYPAGLSLTAMVCSLGAFIGTIVTFLAERGNTSVWALGWDAKLLAYVYGGVISSGITYYLSGVIMKEKGPVFVTAFNPLSMVIVAIMSSFIFAEQMTVGKVTGATVIVIGLYLVIWGKNKDLKEIEPPQQQQQQSKTETYPSTNIDDSKTDLEINCPQRVTGPDAV
ncbi:wat1-related protein at2g39510 [Phtheirospermum japonicum]|uniref:WAT1-related protein n=1 Tax=Phtheirospermum japonicum TaxID=374723 RepID=A0A830CW84_9LAMI|nr:wat1-related protein at2g39510 [Phtheirospermum japonicum]